MKYEGGIHPTAIISEGAKIGEGVTVGPWSLIGPNVEIGDGTEIHSHVTIEGHTVIGKNNIFHPYCAIGGPPQDLGYKGEPTRVQIGDGNTFREYCNVHRGTMKDNQITIIGNSNYFMGQTHVAHDCILGNNIVIANNGDIAGHVKISDKVIIGGVCSISPFCTIGRGAYIGGASAIDRDIPMYCTAYGNRTKLKGINIIGLRRSGFAKQDITELVDFYRTMEASAYSPRSFVTQETVVDEFKGNEIVMEMIEFIKNSEIGIAPFIS